MIAWIMLYVAVAIVLLAGIEADREWDELAGHARTPPIATFAAALFWLPVFLAAVVSVAVDAAAARRR